MSITIKSLLAQKKQVSLCETHDSSSTEIIRNVTGDGGQPFDGLWISSLTQTTYLSVPDTELISPLHRATLIALDANLQQRKTRRPLCTVFDADNGGDIADIPALLAVLALVGVSMIIIEDKSVSEPGQKVNSLAAKSDSQDQADMHEFAHVIRAFKSTPGREDMIVTARIESFTVRHAKSDEAEERLSVQEALNDALKRAEVYREAGADAIMIHSKSRDPDEILFFLTEYRSRDPVTPLVVVPTTYSSTMKTSLYNAGANVMIYANNLMRAKIRAAGKLSDKILGENPDLFSRDPELSACLEARNFGCLLRKLWQRRYWGQESKEAQMYRIITTTYASENMKGVVKDLLEGELSSCEADDRIIPVKDLLKINGLQVSAVEDLVA
jgi:2-methylisocitrate lyase-like PEP mutase family enzyme